ncbi:DNA-binding winged helix-turn-helix (wHTH) domain-containing protein [Granulicella rosea]|uniref:DNA-binding winged helix-turn-helix (WHTH) domain-containing protein n=1 Tax=Granulicella rosea TaxID=474952 RepID=A0A239GUK2_9BACT|nr:winged helix-turn-helix domain-containing protein [Granulicella rosea]SNS72555.1 DNA-binding winged helix-turn-helix (wHTH) domain-containing protein [Granulicella rosea]
MPLTVDRDRYRFDEFELQPSRRSLLRDGSVVSLSPKAFEVLTYLVLNPGRVISKEELIKAIWPGSYVEESNLAQQIYALRRALADRSACIATIPGQGYQFTAEVVQATGPESTHSAAHLPDGSSSSEMLVQHMHERSTIVVEERVPNPAAHPGRLRALLWTGFSLAAVALLAIAGAKAWRRFNPPSYGHAEAVVADLDNSTGDTDFDHTLNKVLQIDLQQSPYFTVISEGRARRTLKMMRQPADEPITAPLAREICQRVNGQLYLAPAIAKVGDRYHLSLLAYDCGDGHTLGALRETVRSKNDVLATFSDLTEKIRRSAGEPRASVKEFSKPVYDEPTSSLEALKAYSEATRLGDGGKFAESIALYQHAVQLDPNFAVAYADMSTMYYNTADWTHDKQAIAKAYALRDTVNEREHFYIELRYHQSVTGDLHSLIESLRRWAATYPEDNLPVADLVNFETWTGQYPMAAAHAEAVLALEAKNNIHNGISYEISARAFHHANMPDRVRAVYAEALRWGVDTQGMHGVRMELAAEDGDRAELARQEAWGRGTPAESHMLQMEGSVELAQGHVAQAESLFARARIVAQRDKVEDTLADMDEYQVRMLAELGLTAEAKAQLKAMPASDPSLDKAFAEAAVGEKEVALAETRRQQAASPTDTLLNVEYAPSVRAIVALEEGKPQEAVALMQASAPYELRDPTVPYLRGQAYLAARQPAEAEVEFNKLADRPWLADPPAPLIPLAHLGLARAYAMQGQFGESGKQYKALLDAWQGADSDLPVLKQARQEYAQVLKSSASTRP